MSGEESGETGPIVTRRNLAKITHERYVEEPQKKIQELNQKLIHDTRFPDLLNDLGFKEKVTPLVDLATRTDSNVLFVFLDVDRLKPVNDVYGHVGGDRVIELLSEELTEHFQRESDELAHRSGDEFLIAISATEAKEVERLLLEAREEFEEKSRQIAPDIAPSFSFGIANMRERLVEGYDKDLIRKGNMDTITTEAVNVEPAFLMMNALQVAEMRMYSDKISRGQERK